MEPEAAPARRKVSSHLEQILSQMNTLKSERAEQEMAAERTRLDFEGEKKKYAEGAVLLIHFRDKLDPDPLLLQYSVPADELFLGSSRRCET